MADQIGLSGKAFHKGIPAATITWNGRPSGSHSVTIFNDFRVRPDCDIVKSYGNNGEFLSQRRRNKRWAITVTTKPAGNATSDALAILYDPPHKLDIVTISGADDDRLNHAYWMVEETAEVSYTPEGEATMTLSLECYWTDDTGGKAAVAAVAALS